MSDMLQNVSIVILALALIVTNVKLGNMQDEADYLRNKLEVFVEHVGRKFTILSGEIRKVKQNAEDDLK